jgi:PKD repeat protein
VKFTAPGLYTIKLKATNTIGSDSLIKVSYISVSSSTVQVPGPQFAASVTNTTANAPVQLTDQSSNTPTFWKWTISPATYSFVSPSTSSYQNPKVKFNATGLYTIKLKVTNAAGVDSLTKVDYINIDGAVSLSELTATSASFFVFPNPVKDEVTVELSDNSDFTGIKLYDMYGKVIRANTTQDKKMNMQGLPQGIYFISVTFKDKGEAYRKIIKE